MTVNSSIVLNDWCILREDLQRLWFSQDGFWAIVESSAPNNHYCIRIWNVENVPRRMRYDYTVSNCQIQLKEVRLTLEKHDNPTSTNPIHSIIPFPRSPRCILWDEHSNVCILTHTMNGTPRPLRKIEGLQAIVITPDEKHVIFVVRRNKKGFSVGRCSKILSSSLREKDGHLSLTLPYKELRTLENLIVTPGRSAIAVDDLGCQQGAFTYMYFTQTES